MTLGKPFNLFVYGTLMNPSVFRAVLGKRFVTVAGDADGEETILARDAILSRYRKISPDNTYLYAVPDPNGWIRGYLIGPLPVECLENLRRYEGMNYSRRTVHVRTAYGTGKAFAFVGNLKKMAHAFGYEFHDPFKQEVLLRKKIESVLLEMEKERFGTSDPLTRRALAELHGSTIRDLVRKHFDAGGISDFAIRHSLTDATLRDFSRIAQDASAAALAGNYLNLVIRQVIFNEVEERIWQDFRYELDRIGMGGEFYERTLSCLAALRLLNEWDAQLRMIVASAMSELSFPDNSLVEFVRWAIVAADGLYSAAAARSHVMNISLHVGRRCVPMGAELEFSNIGHEVIKDPAAQKICDCVYDGFIYSLDFALDVLTWKLGGHIDDHHCKYSPLPRRGFFEAALGSLSIEAGISKPVTDDPWVLNELIHQVRLFFPITPHSLHISLQIRSRRRSASDRLLPLGLMKCLFAIAGDPVRLEGDGVRIVRLTTEEIIRSDVAPQMLFSEISHRHSAAGEDSVAMIGSMPG